MSGILRRTIFVDDSNGYVVFHDWAKVTTGLGTMVEPRCVFAQRPFGGVSVNASKVDPTDDINRVDALERIAIGEEKSFLADETVLALHGGALWQRVGY
jgi:hypothetical protein